MSRENRLFGVVGIYTLTTISGHYAAVKIKKILLTRG
jgi:hypothetical protein